MTKTQELFFKQAEIKKAKHPKTAPKIISFSLAMAFFGLSIIVIGIAHGLDYSGITVSWMKMMMMILAIITLQGAVVCSSLGVASCRYTIHWISSVSLAVSLAIDIGLIVYYTVWVV